MFMITTSKYFDIFQGKKQYFEKEYLREKKQTNPYGTENYRSV